MTGPRSPRYPVPKTSSASPQTSASGETDASITHAPRRASAPVRLVLAPRRISRVSVVNGAQTVGVIGNIVPPAGAASEAIQKTLGEQSWVQIRIISLDRCPPGFDRSITQATNFQ